MSGVALTIDYNRGINEKIFLKCVYMKETRVAGFFGGTLKTNSESDSKQTPESGTYPHGKKISKNIIPSSKDIISST